MTSWDNSANNGIGFAAILFGIYTAIIPIDQVANVSGSGTINKYVGILVLLAIIADILLHKKPLVIEPPFIVLFVFASYTLISYYWSVNREETYAAFISLLSLLVFYGVCINKNYTDEEKNFIKLCCIFGGLLISLYLISTKDLYYNRVYITTGSGSAADPNGLSSSLAFGALLLFDYLLRSKTKVELIFAVSGMAIICYGMMLTGSRAGMLGLIMGVVLLSLLDVRYKVISKDRVLLVCIVSFIILCIVFGSGILFKYVNARVLGRLTLSSAIETGGTGRLTIWLNALQIALERPFLGYGFGGGPYILLQQYGTYIGTHNVVLFLLLGTGLLGLGIMLGFILLNVKTSLIRKDALTLSMMVMLIAFGGTLDYLLNKNLWNVMIYSQIGLGVTQRIQRKPANGKGEMI